MKIEIIIATRNRYGKLLKTLDSIPDKYQVKIICDGDLDTFRELLHHKKNFALLLYNEFKQGAVSTRNTICETCSHSLIYSTDDMTFNDGAIEQAENEFNDLFPDTDGVLGFTQTGNRKFHPAGVALVGKKFLDRYPGRHLFFPDYYHFACQEIYWLADKLNKFHFSEKAIINHMNPMVNPEHMDQTHHDGRIFKDKDHALIKDRLAKGLIWGM